MPAPALPPPIKDRLPTDFSVVVLRRPVAVLRTIRYVRAADDGAYPVDAVGWAGLREQLANHLWDQFAVFDFIMCVRAGCHGRHTPLVVNLPCHGPVEIVVITDGTPASDKLRHPGVRVGRDRRLTPFTVNLPRDTYPRMAMVTPSRSSSSWTGHKETNLSVICESNGDQRIEPQENYLIPGSSATEGCKKLEIRNTVTCSFNGTPEQVARNLFESTIHFLNWNKLYGTEVCYDSVVGQKASMFTTRPSGTFHYLLKHEADGANLIIDARTGWCCGFVNAYGIWLFSPDQPLSPSYVEYINHIGVVVLPRQAVYREISPGGLKEDIEIGFEPVVESIKDLSCYHGSMDTKVLNKLMISVGRAIYPVCEGMKFNEVLELNLSVIKKGTSTTIRRSENSRTATYLKGWGKICESSNSALYNFLSDGRPIVPFGPSKKYGSIRTVREALTYLNLAPFLSVSEKMCSRQGKITTTWCPVDSGQGDSEISLLSKVDLSSFSRSYKEKFKRDTEYYLGRRVGGPPHWSAVNFVNRRRATELNPYRGSLPITYGPKVPSRQLLSRLARVIRCFGL